MTNSATLDLLEFRRSVSMEILQRFSMPRSKSGPVKTLVASRVSEGSRFDNVGHYIISKDKRTRCAVCKSTT